ncbi:MAG: hypothetical protein HUJ76_06045 [Parasporobacterium sp.]|nr:hypothetical protein [Parasporobacterium sp.]
MIIIILADVFLIASHDRTFSPKENRVLQQAPELTGDGLASGKYMTQAEDFVADQFFLRDGWISYKMNVDKILGKKESNGIYLGKNGYLIEAAAVPDEKNMSKNLDAIADFCSRHDFNAVMSVVPNAVSICSHLLPAGAPAADQMKYLADIRERLSGVLQFADVSETLNSHNREYIYYKSDHHWTSLGAYHAFNYIAPYIGIDSPVNAYDIYCVTDSFTGTLSSASGAASVRDEIDIYVPKSDVRYVVEYVNENEKSTTVYRSEALETNSKYDVFLGGNHPLIRIRTTAGRDRNLMIIKDSYANAFVQFLLPYYDSIYIVDPRYYSDDIEKLLSEGSITDVLFLYNLNTFVEDNSIAGVLETF